MNRLATWKPKRKGEDQGQTWNSALQERKGLMQPALSEPLLAKLGFGWIYKRKNEKGEKESGCLPIDEELKGSKT